MATKTNTVITNPELTPEDSFPSDAEFAEKIAANRSNGSEQLQTSFPRTEDDIRAEGAEDLAYAESKWEGRDKPAPGFVYRLSDAAKEELRRRSR